MSDTKRVVKKKKRKIKKFRVFVALIIFFLIVYLFIKLIMNLSSNIFIGAKIYSEKSNIISIEPKKNTLKLSKNVINYMKNNNKKIKLKYDGNEYIIGNKVKDKISLSLNYSNEKIQNPNFNYSKGLYIEKNELIESSDKVSIKLPKYLYKNEYVDIYGIDKNGDINVIDKCKKIKNKYISFKIKDEYSKYFITYVKVNKIELDDNFEVTKNDEVSFKIKFFPTTATNKSISFDNINESFIARDNRLIALKPGNFKVKVIVEEANIIKNIKIKVNKNESKIVNRDGLTYIDNVLIVNKTYDLPKDYNPGAVSKEAMQAFNSMKDAALKDSIKLWIASGFRSYKTQTELYENYTKNDGKEKADTYSARPGHSEHQTGLAMDLNIIDSSFEGTPEAIWIEKNCYKYGFIIRYPKGKDSITGYKYEPWHIRYLGVNMAKKVHDSGQTLEEYFGITSTYSN